VQLNSIVLGHVLACFQLIKIPRATLHVALVLIKTLCEVHRISFTRGSGSPGTGGSRLGLDGLSSSGLFRGTRSAEHSRDPGSNHVPNGAPDRNSCCSGSHLTEQAWRLALRSGCWRMGLSGRRHRRSGGANGDRGGRSRASWLLDWRGSTASRGRGRTRWTAVARHLVFFLRPWLCCGWVIKASIGGLFVSSNVWVKAE